MPDRAAPLDTIRKLVKERYSKATSIFWAGSVSQGKGTSASDLDLVIVFEEVAHAYREAFIYDGWPIDAFIHDAETLSYFLEESRADKGISGTISMILHGQEITSPSAISQHIKALAKKTLKAGPAAWDQKQIDKERFLITDVLDDIKYPVGRDEQIASAAWLLEALGQFYFRSQNKWCASGKSLIRYIKNDDPEIAAEFTAAFQNIFQLRNSSLLESLVEKILKPYGGLLWDGFSSHATTESRIIEPNSVLEDLKKREPIFHHPDIFGRTEGDIINLMCDEFWEVGASGTVYTKQDVIETLLERYNDPDYQDIWEAKDFEVLEIAPHNYLLTYTLLQGERITKRSTIWRRTNQGWKILYHQGTIVNGG